jgi:hypothetical protein
MNLVWFNGESAELFHKWLPPQNLEVGTNFIQEKRPVHVVCAYDIPIIKQIKLDPTTEYYTRPDGQSPGWKVLTDLRLGGTNSGMLAVYVALQKSSGPIYILGCDWGLNDQSIFDQRYGHTQTKTKYNNGMKRTLKSICQNRLVYVINNNKVDTPLPVMSVDNFLLQIHNK